MRTTLSRIAGVTAGAALTALLLPAAPAAAETSTSCNPATSQVLLEPTDLGGYPNNFIYLDQQGARRLLCFNITFMNAGSGVIIVAPVTGGMPVVADADSSPSSCPQSIVDNSTIALRYDTSPATPSVCFRVGGVAKKIGLLPGQAPGVPTFEVWRDGTFSELDRETCPVEYLEYLSDPSDPDNDDCMTTPTRVFPPA